ncbi:MAG: class I SAM-dependent methyltransferase [candidate division WOR-3 bacterium]
MKEKDFWDFYSEIYDEKKKDFDLNFRRINFLILENYLKDKNFLLEIGCGTGTDTEFMVKRVKKILALDLSIGMLKRAKEKIKNGKVYLINMKAEDIDLLRKKFDGAYSSFGVLNCLYELESFFDKLSKVLKKNSIFVFSIINRFYFFDFIFFLIRKYNFFKKRLKGYGKITVDGKEYDCIARYYSYKYVIRCLKKNFRVIKIFALPFLVPPSYLRPHRKLPSFILKILFKIENFLFLRYPFNIMGEQLIFVIQRK